MESFSKKNVKMSSDQDIVSCKNTVIQSHSQPAYWLWDTIAHGKNMHVHHLYTNQKAPGTMPTPQAIFRVNKQEIQTLS